MSSMGTLNRRTWSRRSLCPANTATAFHNENGAVGSGQWAVDTLAVSSFRSPPSNQPMRRQSREYPRQILAPTILTGSPANRLESHGLDQGPMIRRIIVAILRFAMRVYFRQ